MHLCLLCIQFLYPHWTRPVSTQIMNNAAHKINLCEWATKTGTSLNILLM